MFKHKPQAAGRTRRLPGFTLIELMVVIGIIGLLIAISVPAYTNFRKQAKRTTTGATINTLDVGIASFRADGQLGGNYPLSSRIPACKNPHYSGRPGVGSLAAQELQGVNGGELLAWALVGADRLGTPGFKNLDGSTAIPANADNVADDSFYGGWTSDSSAVFTAGSPTLYALDNAGAPVSHRTSSFVEVSKMKFPTPDGNGRFKFDQTSAKTAPTRDTISFLDSFGGPILYYRANRTAQQFVSFGYDDKNSMPAIPPSGIYQLWDNAQFTGLVSKNVPDSPGIDLGAGSRHPLAELPETTWPTDPATQIDIKGSFGAMLQNLSVTAKRQPHRDDSYILLSAGPDGLFGTGDDVANFPVNE